MVFKDGWRAYFVVPKKEATAAEAAVIANRYFKVSSKGLVVQSGRMIDRDTVEIGVKGDQWVVSRKGRR